MHKLEFRRQLLHITYGSIIVLLHHFGIFTLPVLAGMIIGGIGMSFMIKKQRLNPVKWILSLFERDHHIEKFPGRGIIFFTIGAFFTLLLFQKNIAYAGILILSFGDAMTNLIGRHYGKIKTKLNGDKYIEGTLVGIIVSFAIAYSFFPNILAAFAAACVAMFLEMPSVKVNDFEIDDNLLIPLGASFTLSLFL